jgi:hypothetical protein
LLANEISDSKNELRRVYQPSNFKTIFTCIDGMIIIILQTIFIASAADMPGQEFEFTSQLNNFLPLDFGSQLLALKVPLSQHPFKNQFGRSSVEVTFADAGTSDGSHLF